ncbi:MAG: hypothetical protein C0402_13400 [Thermodesulfovibrio sp.]|nr:hypothetical protein [Thermodesulfovibrio sp.]
MQLPLPFTGDQDILLTRLKQLTNADIRLVLTDNGSSMISFRKNHGVTFLRLHRMFLQAAPDVVSELAGFINNRRMKTPLIRQFIREHAATLPVRPARKTVLVAQGRYHDLSEMARAVNLQYFEGRITAGITWGTRKTGHAVRRRILGSYNSRTNIIRVNPILDRKNVPQYYLEFIVYHEMLHADMGVAKKNNRREVHSQEFRRREKLFRHFEKALLWEKK